MQVLTACSVAKSTVFQWSWATLKFFPWVKGHTNQPPLPHHHQHTHKFDAPTDKTTYYDPVLHEHLFIYAVRGHFQVFKDFSLTVKLQANLICFQDELCITLVLTKNRIGDSVLSSIGELNTAKAITVTVFKWSPNFKSVHCIVIQVKSNLAQ